MSDYPKRLSFASQTAFAAAHDANPDPTKWDIGERLAYVTEKLIWDKVARAVLAIPPEKEEPLFKERIGECGHIIAPGCVSCDHDCGGT